MRRRGNCGRAGRSAVGDRVLFYGGAFVECARRIDSFRQGGRGIQLGIFQSGVRLARRTWLTDLFEIPVQELWKLPVDCLCRGLGTVRYYSTKTATGRWPRRG
jgi:hypothetical protein